MSMEYGYAQRGLYRSRRGMLFGVCKGLAEYFDLSLFWLRVIVLVLFVSTGFIPAGLIYILAALLMKLEPRYSAYTE